MKRTGERPGDEHAADGTGDGDRQTKTHGFDFRLRDAHAEGKQHHGDGHVAQHLDGGHQRRPDRNAEHTDKHAKQGGKHGRHAPDRAQADAAVQQPGTERKVRQTGEDEQRHGGRQRLFAKSKHGQRQAEVGAVVERHRRQHGAHLPVAGLRQRQPAERGKDEIEKTGGQQGQVGSEVKFVSGQGCEGQRRGKHVHGKTVGVVQVGAHPFAGDEAERGNGEKRKQDFDDPERKRAAVHVASPFRLLCCGAASPQGALYARCAAAVQGGGGKMPSLILSALFP